jgi:hypothetical protein
MKDAWRSAEKYPLFEFLLVVPFVRVDLPHCMMDVSDRYLPCMPRIGCGVPEIAPADLTSAEALESGSSSVATLEALEGDLLFQAPH